MFFFAANEAAGSLRFAKLFCKRQSADRLFFPKNASQNHFRCPVDPVFSKTTSYIW